MDVRTPTLTTDCPENVVAPRQVTPCSTAVKGTPEAPEHCTPDPEDDVPAIDQANEDAGLVRANGEPVNEVRVLASRGVVVPPVKGMTRVLPAADWTVAESEVAAATAVEVIDCAAVVV